MKSLKVIIRWIFLLKLVSSIKEENEKVIVEENSLDYQKWHRIPDDLHHDVKSKTANSNEKIFYIVHKN